MYLHTLLSTLVATTIAAPFVQRQASTTGESETWQPSADTKTTCDTNTIGNLADTQSSTAINDACASMMPGCAYQDRLPPNTFCTATVDYPIDGPRSSTQHVGSSSKRVDIKFNVVPASKPGIMWKVEDCYGYFALMLEKKDAEGGCHTDQGAGTGSVAVGGNTTLAGTVFTIATME